MFYFERNEEFRYAHCTLMRLMPRIMSQPEQMKKQNICMHATIPERSHYARPELYCVLQDGQGVLTACYSANHTHRLQVSVSCYARIYKRPCSTHVDRRRLLFSNCGMDGL